MSYYYTIELDKKLDLNDKFSILSEKNGYIQLNEVAELNFKDFVSVYDKETDTFIPYKPKK